MQRTIFASVADDDTGATDLAGMLADQDLRTVLVIDLPPPEDFAAWTRDADAVIVGVASRAAPPQAACERTRQAIRLLETLRPRVIQIKYCSTFDSSPEGNIGPSIDAAMEEMGESFTVALPALPVNGRTTYMGYHFVHQQLLSDSPMRRHPLTPMTDPNLVTHLQSQTRRKVGLVAHPVVRDGAGRVRQHFEELQQQGVAIAILDCLSDADLEVLCEAMTELRLITGSSAPAIKLPALWQRRGWWQPSIGASAAPERQPGRGLLVAAGSCSEATRRQNAWLEAQGARIINLEGERLAEGEIRQEEIVAAVAEELAVGRACLLRTATTLEDVARVQQWAASRGKTATQVGEEIARALAALVSRILAGQPPEGLIVAGGDTAGTISRALGLGALRVGKNIEPGVPLCHSLGRVRLPVVLKSGNFGSTDFYGRAQAAIRRSSRQARQ